MTRAHGRHLGLVRGGRSAPLRATLHPGATVGLVGRARLGEHLGAYAVEPLSLRAGRLMASALALAGINYLAALTCSFLGQIAPTGVASGRVGVRPKPVIPLRARSRFLTLSGRLTANWLIEAVR